MKDWHSIQRQATEQLARKGYILIADSISHEEFATRTKSKQFPPKATWFWKLQEVWAPRQESAS